MPGLAVLAQHVLSGLLDRKSHCSVSNIMISFYFYFFPLADAHMSVGKKKNLKDFCHLCTILYLNNNLGCLRVQTKLGCAILAHIFPPPE